MLGPQDITEAESKEAQEEEKPEPTVLMKVDENELDRIAVARSLGMDGFKNMKAYASKLDTLIEWSKAFGAKDQIDMIGNIKQMQGKIGHSTIHDMVIWAHLDMERIALIAKQAKFAA